MLAFCFVFDVPIGGFFKPPSGDLADALEMPKHPAGIGWNWGLPPHYADGVPTSTSTLIIKPTGCDVQSASQIGGHSTIESETCFAAVGALNDDELQMYFLLGLVRRLTRRAA